MSRLYFLIFFLLDSQLVASTRSLNPDSAYREKHVRDFKYVVRSRSLQQDGNTAGFPYNSPCNRTSPCPLPGCCSGSGFCGIGPLACYNGCQSGACYNVTTGLPNFLPFNTAPSSPASAPLSASNVSSRDTHSKSAAKNFPVIATIFISVAVIFFVILVAWCVRGFSRKQKEDAKDSVMPPGFPLGSLIPGESLTWRNSNAPLDHKMAKDGPRGFRVDEILRLTENFSDDKQIGEGGFGRVYKVISPKGEAWAVKRSTRVRRENRLAFEREVLLIHRMNQRNLVSLVGWCIDEEEHILVYEYVANGDLSAWIHGPLAPSLTVEHRLKIAASAARGLNYVHSERREVVVHRDIKSNNILLDENMEAKVADFGLSKLVPDGDSGFYTNALSGTRGYLCPEYVITHKVSPSLDVYGFGIVLLELLSGRKPLLKNESISGNKTGGTPFISLADWARQHIENGFVSSIFYPEMECMYHQQALTDFAQVALRCVEPCGSKRPTMHEVYLQLEGIYRNAVPFSPLGLVTSFRAPPTPLEIVTSMHSLITRSL